MAAAGSRIGVIFWSRSSPEGAQPDHSRNRKRSGRRPQRPVCGAWMCYHSGLRRRSGVLTEAAQPTGGSCAVSPDSRDRGVGVAATTDSAGYARLDALWRRGREFLGCEYAILCGAMSWVSEHDLVAAISEAGGFGVLAAAAMPPEQLEAEIGATRDLTAKPFGVNLVTLHPLFDQLVDLCIRLGVGTVVLAGGGLPAGTTIKRLKDAGVRVVCFAPALPVARRLVRSGADALIIEGREAGGHVGPSTTAVLMQEILPHVRDVPVFVAGGIGRGEGIVACLELGAAGCQLGTKFACAKESRAHPRFKKALIDAAARDTSVSPQLDPRLKVVPVRALSNRAMAEFVGVQQELLSQLETGQITAAEAQESVEYYWAGRLRRAVVGGDIESGSVMCGQSVGLVTGEQSVAEIIGELVDQAVAAIDGRRAEMGA